MLRSFPRLMLLLPLALLLAGGTARAQSTLPTGGHVVAGSATIAAPSGSTLSITQTSPKAIVNWNTFSVGQPNAVQFNQPGSSAAILNRVTGSTSSTIAGQLDANGQVYLVNPNGIAITSTGSVQVGGGFVASTLGISDSNFMSGNLSFTGNGASAGLSNAGSITAGPGGYVGLIGGAAANSGVISVPLGKVALGSGEAATLDLNGDGFMQVAVPTGATTAKGHALVSNSGRIDASGGMVQLQAATVASAIRNAVNMSGVIAANSVSGHDGAITLSGGPGGAVNVRGTLDASAAAASGANGGSIDVSGARVRVGHHAVLNASGAKGGSVLVGVTAPGGIGEARSTTIASGAQILATGNPAVAGSGGFIETSGGTLTFGGATINPGKGGAWLADPTDLTIDTAAATTISDTLNHGSDVVEETAGDGTTSGLGNTSSGAGDIVVDAAISWGTSNTLTLSAFNGITVNAPITISGAGNLVLTTNNNINGASTGAGTLAFTPTLGSAQFTNTEGGGQTLTINGAGYTLLYNMGEVQAANGNVTGNYALAIPLNAATDSTTPMNWMPLGESTAFTGNFNGLGNTISNLTINDTTDPYVGLFGQLGTGGTISNIGLVGGSVTGAGNAVGGLVGSNGQIGVSNSGGTISYAYATGVVTGTGSGAAIGGLAAINTEGGTIADSFATGAVNGNGSEDIVGGLAGANTDGGTITGSYATGAVTSTAGIYLGGLVGINADDSGSLGATIRDSYATGAVTGTGVGATVGGLVGYNFASSGTATISNSFATGAVTSGEDAGGLVGDNSGSQNNFGSVGTATISNSYATGAVAGGSGGGNVGGLVGADGGSGGGTGAISNSYATGAVSSSGVDTNVGGLVGASTAGDGGVASITDAYATGSVAGGFGSVVGGLVGFNFANSIFNPGRATITDAFATGAVLGHFYGGLVGSNNGTITDGYYDANTSGMPLGAQGDGSVGLTTAALQAALPTFQNASAWGIIPRVSYPYLTAIYPTAPPQVISGIAYTDAGVTPFASPSGTSSVGPFESPQPPDTVSALVGGTSLGSATTGANGYYYFLEPAGTIANTGSAVMAYTVANPNTGAANAASVVPATGSVTGLTIWGNTLIAPTSQTTYSGVLAASATSLQGQDSTLIAQAVGSNNAVSSLVAGLGNYGYIATGASFTIDTSLNLTSPLYLQTLNGAPIAVDAAVTTSAALTLDATGPLTINAAITETGPSPVVLNGTNTAASVTFTPGHGSLEFTDSEGAGQTLTIGDPVYTLLYTIAEVQAINTTGLAGNYALAMPIDASSATSWTPVGSFTMPFTGGFNGLGNTISNLTINDTTDPDVGLFGAIGSTGSVSNLALSGPGVTGARNSVGALAGINEGAISNVTSSIPVTGTFQVGGLVGDMLGGSIIDSSSSGGVTGEVIAGSGAVSVGGLVGEFDAGSIAGSSASGPVTAPDGVQIGGLIGLSNAGTTVSNSFATGNVTAVQLAIGGNAVGGLIGFSDSTVTNSYATGAVTGGGNDAGGLIGINDTSSGGVTLSYATGAVNGGFNAGGLIGYDNGPVATVNVFATGAVSGGGNVGGLIGELDNNLREAYATGPVSGNLAGIAAGGLVGQLDGLGSITDAYATGAVSGVTGVTLGGLTGQNGGIVRITNGYYDANTTGMPYDGVVGLTTAQLQAALPTFQNPSSWGIIPGVSYPYLTAFYPTTPQVISGTAYTDAGVTPLASPSGTYSGAIPANGTVTALVGGVSLGTLATGANGYYYFLEPAGTIPSNGGVLTYSPGAGASGGAAFADGITGGGVSQATHGALLTIFGNTLHEITADTENSVLQGNLGTALGHDPIATPLLAGLPNLRIDASGVSFDVDSTISYSGNVTLNVFDGGLTLDQPVNANNGSTTLGASPGLVSLAAFGDITQSASGGNDGMIIAGQLYAASIEGSVNLTADNRIGANDNGAGIATTPGRVAGFANGNFRFVNYDAPLTIDTLSCGCGGIFANFGNIDLATKGAGGIIVDVPLNAGNNIGIAVANRYKFTNNASDDIAFDIENGLPFTYGIDATAAGGSVTILADHMNLSNGTIGAGIVVLGPKTHSENIVLGGVGTTTTLALQTADLANVHAGAVQIGYRQPDGAVSLTGDITITNNFTINTDDVEGLLLVTGGSVNETGRGAIVGTDPFFPLELGIIASGTNSLDGANRVGTLAAYIDGTNPSLSFTDARRLTVGALDGFQAGVRLGLRGFPIATPMTGAPPDPLSGIVLADGSASSIVTLTTTTAGIALDQPIRAGAGTVTLDSAGRVSEAESGFIAAGTLTGYSTGGALLTGANAVSFLGPWSDTGARSPGLSLVDGEALTVTAGSMVGSLGPVSIDVTSGDLRLAPSASIFGDGIVLATTGDFINDAGANALTVANGSRWLIYSDAPGGDTFGGLDSDNTAIWDASYATLPPASVTESGDRYLFQESPTLTVTTVSDSKRYGIDATAAVANDYVISGTVQGVAGAFLGDNALTLYTGTPSVTSAGSPALASGGPFSIVATAGSLVALDGYRLDFVDAGELTVIGGPIFGASPAKYILPPPLWWGDLLNLQPGLSHCTPVSIAGELHGSGRVRLVGGAGESCGS